MAAPAQPRALRTTAEIDAAAQRLAATWPPLTQEQANQVDALLAPWLPRLAGQPHAA